MNLDAVRKKLQSLQQTSKRQNNLWKPEPGSQIIRLLPNKFQQEFPFVELYFHYGFGGKTYLSPVTFGRPDPLVEFAEKLKATGAKEDYQLARKLEPKMRTYAPVLVRGKESEGVKFWGFGKTVYQELLGFMADEDYGDIADPTSGRDITVEFTPAQGAGEYPKTAIRIKPNQTPVTEDKNVLTMIGDMPDITKIFKEPTYEDLQTALQNWLNPDADADSESKEGESQAPASDQVANDTNTEKVENVGQAFDKLFGENNG